VQAEGVPSNGAVAFSAVYVDTSSDRLTSRSDRRDIYLSLPGQDPRRIVGSDHDGIDQSCPTFSPDGTRLAYLEGPGGPNLLVTTLDVVKVDDGGAPSGIPCRSPAIGKVSSWVAPSGHLTGDSSRSSRRSAGC
jgi:Tol biopolymer transport system component